MLFIRIVTLWLLAVQTSSALVNPISWALRRFTGGQDPELLLRERFINLISSVGAPQRSLRNLHEQKRLQPEQGPDAKFPCDTQAEYARPSNPPPSSVHQVRPADVKVVAAMGDSLTAGNGALATTFLQIFTENRGVVWSIGGEGTWRQFLTLPSILREFRPELIGASLGDSLSHRRESQFNVADPNAFSWDMLNMARVLVRRIKADQRVDFDKDWKLVTLLVGSNDLCQEMCEEDEVGERSLWERHYLGLQDALDYLQKNLPRTIVNLVMTPDVTRAPKRTGLPVLCQAVQYLACSCLLSASRGLPSYLASEVVKRVQQAEEDLVLSGRYDVTDDFTVVLQPFAKNISFPKISGLTDLSYLSQDCFHFSQKGYAWAANALWNNMLEPVGHKSQHFEDTFSRFVCPTPERPFIFTSGNSNVTV